MWKVVRFAAARSRRFSTAIPGPCKVHKRGTDILHDPWFNKVHSLSFHLQLRLRSTLFLFDFANSFYLVVFLC